MLTNNIYSDLHDDDHPADDPRVRLHLVLQSRQQHRQRFHGPDPHEGDQPAAQDSDDTGAAAAGPA